MSDILARMPADWKITVTRITGGGRDALGDPQPSTETPVEGCLLAPNSSDDPEDFSAFVTDAATLYAPLEATFTSEDRVRTPEGSPLPGTWAVDGSPVRWPYGWAVPLRRE